MPATDRLFLEPGRTLNDEVRVPLFLLFSQIGLNSAPTPSLTPWGLLPAPLSLVGIAALTLRKRSARA